MQNMAARGQAARATPQTTNGR